MAGRPKMCGNCGKLMGVADVCPYCGVDNNKVAVRLKRAASASRRGAGAGAFPVTVFMVGANLFLFAIAIAIGGARPGGGFEILSLDGETLLRLGGHFSPAIAAGDWWRLFTAIFLHGGLLHVFFNSFILWIAGRHLEAELGSRLMFLIYMLAGVLGFVASYVAGITFTVGASGAVSGLLGALLVRRWLVDGHFRNPITMWVIQLIVLTAIFGLVVSQVNNVAHLVGFLTGAGVAFLLTKVRLSKAGAVGLMLLTTALAVATAAALASMAFNLSRASGEDVVQAARCVDKATAALVDEGRSVDPARAAAALTCVDELPDIAGEADDALGVLRDGLKAGAEAHRAGDLIGEQDGARKILDGHGRFSRWLDANHARYGLGRP